MASLLGRKDGWHVYDNDLEKKMAFNRRAQMPGAVVDALDDLLDPFTVDELQKFTMADAPGLVGDETLHGGGVHCYAEGGYLGPHLDYARHPHLPDMERRLNAILFLNDVPAEDGGAFAFYDDMAHNAIIRIQPRRGRLLLWEPSDTSFHGCERLKRGIRTTLAVFYIAPARETATRKRALFVPARG